MPHKPKPAVPSKTRSQPVSGAGQPAGLARRDHSRLISAAAIGVFILLFSLIAITSFMQESPTVDEPVHLLGGYSYLKWGDFRVNPEHPPLAKMLAALPLLFFDINDPRPSSLDWNRIPSASPAALYTVNTAARLLFVENDAATLFGYAKLMMIALAIFLGLFVFKWSRELFGIIGGIVSLFLYALDPNILAHSRLIHTDLPFTAFFFIATYFFVRTLNRFSVANFVFTIFFFGLASITKYAYTIIIFVWAILGGMRIFSSDSHDAASPSPVGLATRWQKTLLLGAVFAGALATAYLFVWAAYGFRFEAIPGGTLSLPMAEELPRSPWANALISVLLQYRLFPEAWIYGQLHVLNNLSRDTYLLGKMSIGHGSWLYFPVAFAVKTPLPMLLLLLTMPVLWVVERGRRTMERPLVVAVAVYFLFAVWAGINIGLRHILPIFPFLFVLAAGTVARLWQDRNIKSRSAVVALGIWYFFSSLVNYPHYISFFNEIVGGAKNGHTVLLDSNLDWGQGLKKLKHWMVEHDVRKIEFLYFGFFNAAAPRYYGIDAAFVPGSWVGGKEIFHEWPSRADYLAISTNHLYGHFIGGADQAFVKPFQTLEPVATVAHSIRIYNLDEAVEQYRELIAGDAGSAKAHFYFGTLLNHRGSAGAAMEEYRKAIQIDPDYAEAHHSLGMALLKAGDLDEAISRLRNVLQLPALQNRYETQFQLASALVKRGNFREAAHYFREAVKTRPNFTTAYYNLGILAAAQGDMEGAIELFRETLFIDPEHAEAHASLARALAEQGRKDEASKHFQEAIRILKSERDAEKLQSPSS